MKAKAESKKLPRVLPYILLAAGIIGYICAVIIMYEDMKLLQNPHYIPSCDLNPIISCGSVMQSKEASALGIPNPFLGMGGFGALAVIGLAMLAGARFKRWFWRLLNVGALLATGFCLWLFYESVYHINALCPYCMTVWVATITTFWYVTLFNIDQRHIRLPASFQGVYRFVRRHHLDFLILWFLIIAAFILKHFWYYYGRHL